MKAAIPVGKTPSKIIEAKLISGISLIAIEKDSGQIRNENKEANIKTQVLDTIGSNEVNLAATIVFTEYEQAAPRTRRIPKVELEPLLMEGASIKRTPDIPSTKPRILKTLSLSFGR